MCRGQWYNPEKGFGFIAPENREKDIFVHAAANGDPRGSPGALAVQPH
ncbi:cold shock domain-containing protein [Mesorhizobium sp.]|nr:cold shock domain-containing protein [Mesorhizobium sp.]